MILVSIRCLCYFFLTHAFANHRICHAVSQFFINVTVSFPRQSFLSSKYLSYQSLNTWSFTYKCCEQTDKKKKKKKKKKLLNEWMDESVCLQCGRPGFHPWVGKIPWRRKLQPIPVFLPGESHGWKSLVGYSPRRRKESDTTERLHFHFHFHDT